jgi:metallophosphoesterase superfamily enzyme
VLLPEYNIEPGRAGIGSEEAFKLILPVFDAPLLLVEGDERVLVAADLHLGLEYELWLGGVSIPSQTEKIRPLCRAFSEIKPDRLLL